MLFIYQILRAHTYARSFIYLSLHVYPCNQNIPSCIKVHRKKDLGSTDQVSGEIIRPLFKSTRFLPGLEHNSQLLSFIRNPVNLQFIFRIKTCADLLLSEQVLRHIHTCTELDREQRMHFRPTVKFATSPSLSPSRCYF